MIKEPYNQYEPYTDVVYKLVGYEISGSEYETYPRFSIGIHYLTMIDARVAREYLSTTN